MATINTQEDFLRALDENPAWRAAVRAQILGDELLQLPVKFDAFASEASARLAGLEELQVASKKIQADMESRMASIEESQKSFLNDLAWVKGIYARQVAVSEASMIAADIGLAYVGVMSREELVRIARSARDQMSAGDFSSFQRADFIIEAIDGDAVTYVPVEVSFTADQRDTDRALRNARFLTEFTGHSARPAIASVLTDQRIESLIEDGTVHWHALNAADFIPE